MKKKFGIAVLLALLFCVSAGAVGDIFPVARRAADGTTTYGYLDENGNTALPFSYVAADSFADCGLAAVQNNQNKTALINKSGAQVTEYAESPKSVEYGTAQVAFRYGDYSVYYSTSGAMLGSYDGAEGFFESGLLLCKREGSYCYVKQDGEKAFDAGYKSAGEFTDGCALVLTDDGQYIVIDTAGNELYSVGGMSFRPEYFSVYGGDAVVVTNGTNMGIYSLSEEKLLTEFAYSSISPFENGIAIVCRGGRYGMIDTAGKLRTEPIYYHLTSMGGGLYAARGENGSASAVDADGNVAYRVSAYTGGFDRLCGGIAWHGMDDGSIILFSRAGGFVASLKDAEDPEILTANVIRVTQEGRVKYINFKTGKTLYTVPTSFALGNGVTATTTTYEKFIGYLDDGKTEYGWDVTFPVISGVRDEKVQTMVNDKIRAFFLDGPMDSTAEYQSLEGDYGVWLQGSVLIVAANCVYGQGTGSAIWNESIALDLRTGAQYSLDELFTGSDYLSTVKKQLPETHAAYLYVYPRISAAGITYHYNTFESETRSAITEQYFISFDALKDVLNTQGACYRALKTSYSETTVAGFSDVLLTHWAAKYIEQVAMTGTMHGDNGKFRPDDAILTSEVCATIARQQGLKTPGALMDGIDATKWYAGEVSAVQAAGLLSGLEENLQPDNVMTRADAVQLFYNVLQKSGPKTMTEAEIAKTLAPFSDVADVPENRRAAMARCIEQGLVEGSDGKLQPGESFTRAQFAKLLTMAAAQQAETEGTATPKK